MLSCYRVLDLADERGRLCGKILADLGADVVKVENIAEEVAGGRVTPGGAVDLERLAYDQGKRSVTLDLDRPADRNELLRLVSAANLVVESFGPGEMERRGLDYEALAAKNPALVLVRISQFGQTGPYAHFESSDIVAMAMSGLMYVCGEPDGRPVRLSTPYSQAYLHAGSEAAVAAIMALYHQQRTGQGQVIDVAIRESPFVCTANTAPWWELQHLAVKRQGARRTGRGYGPAKGVRHRLIWPCRDGFVAFVLFGGVMGARSNAALVQWMDAERLSNSDLSGIDWNVLDVDMTPEVTLRTIEEGIGAFFKARTKAQLLAGAVEHKIMLYPVWDVADLFHSDHLAQRGYWVNVRHPGVPAPLAVPGDFTKCPAVAAARPRPAPIAGEHNEEILRRDEGRRPVAPERPLTGTAGIFAGLKVAEFSTGAVGPIIGRYFADHGAIVIEVESRGRPCTGRVSAPWKESTPHVDQSGYYAIMSTGKRSVSLNMRHPKARAVGKRLAAWADVVIENFAPGVMERWGLSYEKIAAVNPSVIMLSSTNAGRSGPLMMQPAYGLHLNGLAGFSYLTGFPADEPNNPGGPYSDYVSPRFGTCALISALDYRRRTGNGQYLDHSQLEASLHFLAPLFLDYQLTGKIACRDGNRVPYAAPHNAYRCQGADRWCAIAAHTDDQWRRLCAVMGAPELANDPAFETLSARKQHEETLDAAVERWTIQHPAEAVMQKLQEAKIPVGVVATVADLYDDPQLAHRGFFQVLEHPDMGPFHYFGYPFRFSETPTVLKRSPRLGEDSFSVLRELLGCSDGEVADLVAEGALD